MSKFIKTMNDLPVDVRKQVTTMLQESLAASLDLYTHAKQAHWNVRGPRFNSLHKLFDEVAEAVLPFSDELAERAGQLGAEVSGTLRQSAQATPLKEYPLGIAHGDVHLVALANSFAAYAAMIRENIDKAGDAGDMTTADLYTEISRAVDLKLWFIESHFELEATEKSKEVHSSALASKSTKAASSIS